MRLRFKPGNVAFYVSEFGATIKSVIVDHLSINPQTEEVKVWFHTSLDNEALMMDFDQEDLHKTYQQAEKAFYKRMEEIKDEE